MTKVNQRQRDPHCDQKTKLNPAFLFFPLVYTSINNGGFSFFAFNNNKTSANLDQYTVRDSLCQFKESHFFTKNFQCTNRGVSQGFPNTNEVIFYEI